MQHLWQKTLKRKHGLADEPVRAPIYNGDGCNQSVLSLTELVSRKSPVDAPCSTQKQSKAKYTSIDCFMRQQDQQHTSG
jgi:hypothetical protein